MVCPPFFRHQICRKEYHVRTHTGNVHVLFFSRSWCPYRSIRPSDNQHTLRILLLRECPQLPGWFLCRSSSWWCCTSQGTFLCTYLPPFFRPKFRYEWCAYIRTNTLSFYHTLSKISILCKHIVQSISFIKYNFWNLGRYILPQRTFLCSCSEQGICHRNVQNCYESSLIIRPIQQSWPGSVLRSSVFIIKKE